MIQTLPRRHKINVTSNKLAAAYCLSLVRNSFFQLFFIIHFLLFILPINHCNAQLTPPVIDSVSVNQSTGLFELGWKPSTDNTVIGYIISFHEFANGNWRGIPIDTVWGINTTSWIAPASIDPSQKEYIFIIQAFNISNTSPLGEHQQNVFLQNPTLESCSNQIKIQWSEYKNMLPSLSSYKIYMSVNGGTYTMLQDVGNAALEYNYMNPVAGSTYCFYIQSVSTNGITASSNKRCVVYNKAGVPNFVYLRSASVQNNLVDLQFYADTSGITKFFTINRSDDGTTFTTIATVASTEVYDYYYTDLTSSPSVKSYYYQINAIDMCDKSAAISNTAHTIFINAQAKEGLQNELKWNLYEGFLNGVDTYEIYRGRENGGEVLVYSINANQWTDDISNMNAIIGNFSYRIKAIESGTNNYGFQDASYSNIVFVKQKPSLFIPNAFAPMGNNNTLFGPVTSFFEPTDYLFSIYSRWGELIFETSNKDEMWDGRRDGKDLPLGVYTYILKYTDETGELQITKGAVTLIR